MPSFVVRLADRKLLQWAFAYAAGAWLTLEVVQYLTDMFGWSPSVPRTATVLAGVGLLLVLVLAWFHGEKGGQKVGGLEVALIGALILLGAVGVMTLGRVSPERASSEGVWTVASLSPEAVDRRLAVLPLANLSADPEANEYLVDGLHEEIRSRVSKIRGLDVPARTSLMRFKNREESSVSEIATRLGSRYVLDGSVRRLADQIRISVQLIDSHTGSERWGQSYDRSLSASALFDIESDVALEIARALEIQLSLTERTSIEERGTDSDEAYDLYLRGLYEWLKYSPASLRRGNELFRQAVDLDPGFAKAWSALGGSFAGMGNFWVVTPDDAFPQAKWAAQRAIDLDPDLAQAHVMLAWVHFSYEYDWQETDRLVRRALELSPGEQEPHYLRGYWLQAMGRFEEAVLEGRRLLELDPLSAPMYSTAATFLYLARRYEESLETARRGASLDPTDFDTRWVSALAAFQIGRTDEAIESLAEALDANGSGDGEALRAAYQSDGSRALWRWLLETARTDQRPPGSMAAAYAMLGQPEEALTWLERAYEARDSWMIQLNDPVFDPIRQDPRFVDLLRRLDLPQARLPPT